MMQWFYKCISLQVEKPKIVQSYTTEKKSGNILPISHEYTFN